VKLIALDLDGTLLNPDGSVSMRTREYLERLAKSGRSISLVTGRPHEEACALMERNGILASAGYPQYMICEERDIYTLTAGRYEPWEPHNSQLFAEEQALLPEANRIAGMLAEEYKLKFFVSNLVYQEKRGFVELIFPNRDAARHGLEKAAELAEKVGLKAVRNNAGLTFRHKQVGKLPALRELIDFLGATPREGLVMGDSHNDLDMLTAGFRSATTANADAEIKAAVLNAGGYVSAACASDGVAEVLARLVQF